MNKTNTTTTNTTVTNETTNPETKDTRTMAELDAAAAGVFVLALFLE